MAKSQPNFQPIGGKPGQSGQSAGLHINATTGGFQMFMAMSPEQEQEAIRSALSGSGATATPKHIGSLRTKPVTMPRHTFLILWIQRPGSTGFLVETELTLFPPATRENDQFELSIVTFSKMNWQVIWFPTEYRNRVQAIATKWGLRFSESGAIPLEFDPKKASLSQPMRPSAKFPISGEDNVFTVENVGGMDRALDERFLSERDALYSTWAKKLPFHTVRVFQYPDAAIQKYPCPVCDQRFRPGDYVALLGQDTENGYYARVHGEHIADVLPRPEPEFPGAGWGREEHLHFARRWAHYTLSKGCREEAFNQFADYLRKHPATANHPKLVDGYNAFLSGELDDPRMMRLFIEGVQ